MFLRETITFSTFLDDKEVMFKDVFLNLKDSIVLKLLKITFSIYFLITLFITALQMYQTYMSTKKDILLDLRDIQFSFKKGMESAIFQMDYIQLQNLADGILKLSYVKGVKVKDTRAIIFKKGEVFKYNNQVKDEKLSLKFNLNYGHQMDSKKGSFAPKKIGEVTVYSNASAVMERVYIGFVLIIFTAIIKAIILFILFVIVFQKYLREPLKKLEDKASQINFEDLKPIKSGLEQINQKELKSLERALNTTISNLMISKKRIILKQQERDIEFSKSSKAKEELEKKVKEVSILNEKVSKFNEALEEKVKQQTFELEGSFRRIHGMLTHIKLAIFVVDSQGLILPPTSNFSQEIFKESIEGKNALNLLFFHLRDGSKEKDILASYWTLIFGSDSLNFEISVEYLPKKVIQPNKDNPKGKVLKIEYVPLYNNDDIVENLMLIVQDQTEEEEESLKSKKAKLKLDVIHEILPLEEKSSFTFQLGEAIRTSIFSLEDFLVFDSAHFSIMEIKGVLQDLIRRIKIKDFEELISLNYYLKDLDNQIIFADNIEGSRAQIWAVEKISSLIEILFEYADVTQYLFKYEIFPELKFVLPQNFRTIIDEKIGDLERIMTNLLEYVFLVRNLSDLTPEKIANAPKKARLYREFDKIIFHLMNRSKLISFLLKVSHRGAESNKFYELSQLLQQMPSKDKLTEAALMNHLISPYKKII